MAIFQQATLGYILSGDGSSNTFSYKVPDISNLLGAPTRAVASVKSNFAVLQPPLAGPNASPDSWQPNTSYAAGTLFEIKFTQQQGGEQWIAQAVNSGVSGSSDPFVFASEPSQVSDGSILWFVSPLSGNPLVLDIPQVSMNISNKGVVLATFSRPLLAAGSTVTDVFGNVFPVGTYSLTATYFYDGN